MLREAITERMKTALRAKDTRTLSTVRMIMAGLKDRDIAARSDGNKAEIPESEILRMLQGMVKQRRESIELYQKGNRPELAAKEAAEIVVIEEYMPKAAGEEDLRQLVTSTVAELRAQGAQLGSKDMGTVMKAVQAKIQAGGLRADGRLVSEMVKGALVG